MAYAKTSYEELGRSLYLSIFVGVNIMSKTEELWLIYGQEHFIYAVSCDTVISGAHSLDQNNAITKENK